MPRPLTRTSSSIATRSFAREYPAALRLLLDQLAAHPDEAARFLSSITGVPNDVRTKAIGRLEWGVTYPISEQVIAAQQDSADLAFRDKVIPRRIGVREAMLQIK
ncbi:hypothetical protein [Caballeronia sp. Lep1P3]|uniref:hypothetical protein n=1 Tax=Caballeronia sp. Lep1P3 TaxID=2878150 RepID=UPI001FD2C713|nr:hypothetical protein [Caballeronia sp. Lep1P3]